MFLRLGKLVNRLWWLVLIGWLALFAVLWYIAPPWEDVIEEGEFAYLPNYVVTRRGEAVYRRAFPDDPLASNVVIVLHRDEPGGLRDEDRRFIIERLEPRLREAAGLAPADADPDAAPAPGDPSPPAARLRPPGNGPPPVGAADPMGALVPVAAAQPGNPNPNRPPRRRVRAAIQQRIDEILTFQDRTAGPLLTSQDGRATLVIVELITDFMEIQTRPVVELIENTVAELQAQGLVPEGLQIDFTGTAVVGRDVTAARARSGQAVQRWAVWVVIGLLVLIYRAPLMALIPLFTVYLTMQISLRLLALMAQADWIGLFAGIEVYTTVIVYGAGIDYSLFLISRMREEIRADRDMQRAAVVAISMVGAAVAASAATEIIGIGMMYFAEFGKFQQAGITISFSLFVMLCVSTTFVPAVLRLIGPRVFWPYIPGQSYEPGQAGRIVRMAAAYRVQGLWRRIAGVLLKRPGTAWLLTVALMSPFAAYAGWRYDDVTYGLLDELPHDAPSVVGTDAFERYFPRGATAPTTVLLENPDIDFGMSENIAAMQTLSRRLLEREDLRIADIRSIADPLGITVGIENLLPEAPGVQRMVQRRLIRERALQRYVGTAEPAAGQITRFELLLEDDPFSRDSIRHLYRIEEAIAQELPAEFQRQTEVYLVGATASLRDLKQVAERDRRLIEVLVTASVFLILVLLLRRIAVPLYLIISVLFSYFVALGMTFLFFSLFGREGIVGLDWAVPIFLFTLLVAVGEDYNIYLVTRVDEEQRKFGPVRGVTEALARTGGIISSCGLIMAGTFSALALGGELAGLVQLGFALACGVLLDTFVVRTVLVPSYLIMLNSGRFGRFGRLLGQQAESGRTVNPRV